MNRSDLTRILSGELLLSNHAVEAVLALIDEGATIPFIARYRKEATGGLDEVAIIKIRDRRQQLEELDKRMETVLATIREQGKLTPDLEKKIRLAENMSKLEDIYLPFRPKKRTRAVTAREKGLDPLAEFILRDDPEAALRAREFIDPEKGVDSEEDALQGARDIIAEQISEHGEIRSRLRTLFRKKGMIAAKAAPVKKTATAGKAESRNKEEREKFRDYFEYSEAASTAPSHRILAIFRGWKEGFLTVHLLPEEEQALKIVHDIVLQSMKNKANRVQMTLAAADAYKRLIAPSLETELKNELKARADAEAIAVFAGNITELLMAPPMGAKTTLAVDPGLRTGCKIAVLSSEGALLHHEAIYPLPPHNKTEEAARRIADLVEKYSIEAAAVGNGTGGREALAFMQSCIAGTDSSAGGMPDRGIIIQSVNESGASVYSASETARREFPDQDVTVRGAVSIGRRLMDPLSELVKIDPKSIGVGQYQHDVDQKDLKTALDDTVTGCVNRVGVEVNSASPELLSYVAGLNGKTAANIVKRRQEQGPYNSRQELLQVAGMGPKAFEQAAGFLRIRNGTDPLDASAVHPERYGLVHRMAKDLNCTPADLIRDDTLRNRIEIESYVSKDAGLPTLVDIMEELAKPGRDPRSRFEEFSFDEQVHTMEDLREEMVLPGIVTNVTNFGAFVDIGVHQDGLVHISEMADEYVSDPAKYARTGQKVRVKVLSIDPERKRIGLSMKGQR